MAALVADLPSGRQDGEAFGSRSGRDRGHGCGGCPGSVGAAPRPSSPSRGTAHASGVNHEFLVSLHSNPGGRIRLPDAFAKLLEQRKSPGLWLQMDGCPNGPFWVEVDYPLPNVLDLVRGWKAFARLHDLCVGMC